jgi:hypothetical protein
MIRRLPKDKRNKLLLVAGVTLGVAVGLWLAAVQPLRTKLRNLTTQTAEAQEQVSKGQRSLQSAKTVQAELAALSNQLATAEGTMATGDRYAWMIQTMNRFRTGSAVDIPQINRETACEVGMFPKHPYQAVAFVVRGSAFFHDFGKFLADFENQFPYIRVQNLELEAAGGPKSEDSERLQFKMELVTLVKPLTP